MDRRLFLRNAAGLALASSCMPLLRMRPAFAADTSGYKALVCVFLFGGNDGYDTLLPYDQPSYDRFAEIRAPLFNLYENAAGGSSRARDRLLPLDPTNAADFGGREFALPEQFAGVKSLFDSGQAAIVSNVGPLIQPVTATEFHAESVPLPKRLFSHNDQQSTWQSSQPEGAQFGWGGLFADAAFQGGAAIEPTFLTNSTFGEALFLTGNSAAPFQLGTDGPVEIGLLETFERQAANGQNEVIADLLRNHFSGISGNSTSLFNQDYADIMRKSLETNDLYKAAVANLTPFITSFPQTGLGQQLRAVAESISVKDSLMVNRQVFFVGMGGFDTHDNQATTLPALHTQIDEAVTAFYMAMQELGLSQDVTLFTASDFGRTLAINGDGTDHGWAGHHFVIGDAVAGGQIIGSIPPYDFDHDYDAGQGRAIPTTSVEQYAATLGSWFGLSNAELQAALPNYTTSVAAKRMPLF